MPDKLFSERFNLALMQSGVKQADLAKHLGLNQSTITRWKMGVSAPLSTELAEKVARYLKVSPVWLVGLTDDQTPVGPNDTDILRNKIEIRLDAMTKEQMEKTLKFIENFI